MPVTRRLPSARPARDESASARSRRPLRRRGAPLATALAALLVSIGAAGALAGPAGAQVDPEPTTTAVVTTVLPTSTLPPTAVETTVPPVTAPPTTFATTQRPVVTNAPTTFVRPAVVAQVTSTTTTSTPTSTTTSTRPSTTTTAGLLVDGTDTVTTEAVAETDGLSSATKLRLIVGSLIAIAVVIGALTVVYWRKTRPYEWEEWDDGDVDDDAPAASASAPAPGPTPRSDAPAAAAIATGAADRTSTTGSPTERPGVPDARTAAGPTLAPSPTAPVVPSLIDPELRARLVGSTPVAPDQPASAASGAPPDLATAPVAGEVAPGDSGGATAAVPMVDVAPPVTEREPDGPAAEPTRWGTARLAEQVPPSTSAPAGADPDAAFRPPATDHE